MRLRNNILADSQDAQATQQTLFCKKWNLQQAMMKVLDIKFQSDKKFPVLISELYAHAVVIKSKELFDFLETRFNTNIVQDKEIIINFDVVHSREEANLETEDAN